MSDEHNESSAPDQEVGATRRKDRPVTLEGVATSVRRMRRWLVALTAVFVLAAVGSCGLYGIPLFGMGLLDGAVSSVTPAQAKAVERQFREAYGDRLASLTVRTISITYGGESFPLSLMDRSKGLYIEARLTGSGVIIADLLEEPMMLSSSGLLPMKGSLASRMTAEQFDAVVTAYASQTKQPMGPVRRYSAESMLDSGATPETLRVADKTYPTDHVWSVATGRLIKGDSVDLSADSTGMRDALIFFEDPKTGAFSYLGTEQVDDLGGIGIGG